jgi:hypothetical protein
MSTEERLKRLGLDHLKNDPKALKEALDKAVQENENEELKEKRERQKALEEKGKK